MGKTSCGCFGRCSGKKRRATTSRIHAIASVQRSLQQEYEPIDLDASVAQNSNTIGIHTLRPKDTLEVSCLSPSTKQESRLLKYTCPICMRHLSSMLAARCCKNYVCLLCAQDMLARKSTNPALILRCPFCNNQDLHLEDVDPTAPVKKYSNSPDRFISTVKKETPGDVCTPGEVRPFSSASSVPPSEVFPKQLNLTSTDRAGIRSVTSIRSEPGAFRVPAFEYFKQQNNQLNIQLRGIEPVQECGGSPFEISKNSTRPSDTFISPGMLQCSSKESPSPPHEESKASHYISISRNLRVQHAHPHQQEQQMEPAPFDESEVNLPEDSIRLRPQTMATLSRMMSA